MRSTQAYDSKRWLCPLALGLCCASPLLGCSGVSEDAAPRTDAPAAALTYLHADGDRIVDAHERQVILRGLNHLALRSDRNRPTYRDEAGDIRDFSELFDLQDLEEEDFASIASMGLNALRPVLTWEFAQPDPPPAPYNEAYFQLIDDFIAKARRHGLYVVFDFGQFGWGRAAGGNAGAPDWTISEVCGQLPGPVGSAPPQASAAVGCNYYNFWQNNPSHGAGLQDHYIALWQYVAERYRDEPTIAMYDLYNEPFGGPIPPGIFELEFVFPFYRRLAAAIRDIDPHHAIAFQPQLLHSIGVPTPIAEPIGIDNAIYIPHEYTAAYFVQRLDPQYPPTQDLVTRQYLDTAATEATIFGTPWLIGETSWTRSTHADGVGGPIESVDEEAPRQFARDFCPAADELQLGWLWFAYSSIDEAYGINYGEQLDTELIQALARPFPRAVGGRIAEFSFDPQTQVYEQHWANNPGGLHEIALPLNWQFGGQACLGLDDQTVATLDNRNGPVVDGVRFDAARQTLIYEGIANTLRVTGGACLAER